MSFLYYFLKFRYVYFNVYSSTKDFPKNLNTSVYLNKNQSLNEFRNYKIPPFFKIRESFLPIFISSIKKDKLNILDVGGGFNDLYNLIKISSNKDVDMTVLETPLICNIMKKEKLASNNRYLDDIDKINNFYDIIYFGSSFQYFIPLKNYLYKYFKTKSKYIIICDTIFLEKKETFITLQINTYPSIIPHQFNNIKEITDLFFKNNYKLIYKSKRKPGKHNMLKKNEYFTRDLIFEKISNY